MPITNPILSLKPSERLLLRLIRQYQPSRAELSQLSGLTPGAITQYCRKLLFLGLIKENEKAVKKRGQPSFHLSLNQNACCSIGITFLSHEFHLALVDFCGNKIACEAHHYQSQTDLATLFTQLKSSIKRLLEKKFLLDARILGVGLSVSGYLLPDGSRSSPWLPLLQNRPDLVALFEQNLGYSCWVENNINAIAIGEYYSGVWNAINDLVVISLDFGIGAGTISQGKLIQGGFGNAGEVGLFYSYDEPRPTWKELVKTLGIENPTQDDIVKLTEQNDPKIEQWLSHTKPQVLSLIISAIAWFDPKVIVITGMIPTLLTDQIIAYIKSNALFTEMKRPIATLHTRQIHIEDLAQKAAIVPIYYLLEN